MVSKNTTEFNRRWANQKPTMASQDLPKARYVLALILLICCPTRSEDKMSPTLFDDEEFGTYTVALVDGRTQVSIHIFTLKLFIYF